MWPLVGAAQTTTAASLPPDLALVPRDGVYFVTVRLAEAWKSAFLLPLRLAIQVQFGKPLGEFEKSLGVKLADLERLSLVVLNADEDDPAWVLLATAQKPYDRTKVLATLAANAAETKHAGRGYFPTTTPPNSALHFWDERTVLLGPRDAIHTLLNKASRPAKSGPLTEALDLVRKNHQVIVGFDFTRIRKQVPANMPIEAQLFIPLLAMERGCITVDLKDAAQAEVRLHFPGENQAKAGATSVRDLLDLAPKALRPVVLDALGPAKGNATVQKQLQRVDAWFVEIPLRVDGSTVIVTPQMKRDELAVAVAVLLPVVQKLRKAPE
jgi:hypothetical protein